MKHILIEKEHQICKILDTLFSKGVTRFDIPQCLPDCIAHTAQLYPRREERRVHKTVGGTQATQQQRVKLSGVCDNEDVSSLVRKIYKRGVPKNGHNLSTEIKILTKEELFSEFLCLDQEHTFFILDSGFLEKNGEFLNSVKGKSYFIYDPSEHSKNLKTSIEMIKSIPENTKVIFAVGGGITLDISGFVAGLLGLKVEYLATTLLSCVDASIGGKTGVNFFPYGKNQLGLFYGSERLFVVPSFLKTLPKQEIFCGLAEALKHVWLSGDFEEHENLFYKILHSYQTLSFHEWKEFVTLNYKIKCAVVERDPYETSGIRNLLNFGHTIAHVLEALSFDRKITPLPHGIAVAFGMQFLIEQGFVKNENVKFSTFLNELIETSQFKIKKCGDILEKDISAYFQADKKNRSHSENRIVLSLPEYGYLKKKFLSSVDFNAQLCVQEVALRFVKEFKLFSELF